SISHHPQHPPSFPTRRSSDLERPPPASEASQNITDRPDATALGKDEQRDRCTDADTALDGADGRLQRHGMGDELSHLRHQWPVRSEEHTSELQSLAYLVCRLL